MTTTATRPMWDDATGKPVSDPSELNYEATDTCDGCGTPRVKGTMFHAAGATGRVCPVLFLCHSCGGKH